MSSLTLIEIRLPHNEHRADDVLVTAEWRKQRGYVVTHGAVRDGLFSTATASKLFPTAETAVKAALRVAGRLSKAMQS